MFDWRHKHHNYLGWTAWHGFPHAGHGDIGPIILKVLLDKPRHGYEIIKFLEEKSGELWKPSPGSIYPTLQMLEEQGLVSSQEKGGKKVYSLTSSGKKELKEKGVKEPWENKDVDWTSISALKREGFAAMALLKQIMKTGSPEKYKRVAALLAETRAKLIQILESDEKHD